jgi:hypothetical protein
MEVFAESKQKEHMVLPTSRRVRYVRFLSIGEGARVGARTIIMSDTVIEPFGSI